MDLSFFGLTSDNVSQYRANLFSQIHDIVFHGNGGYSWDVVYNMPTWLRAFTYKKILQYFTEKSRQNNEDLASQSQKIKDGKIDLPSHFKGKLGNKTPKY